MAQNRFEKLLREKIGVPIEEAGQSLFKLGDEQIQQLRERQLQQQKQQLLNGSIPAQGQMPVQQDVPMRKLSPEEEKAKSLNALAVGDNMANLMRKEALMRKAMEEEDARRAQEEAEFDPSSYKRVPKPGEVEAAARFQKLQQALAPKPQAPVMPEQVGAIELSEDPEEQERQIRAARLGQ